VRLADADFIVGTSAGSAVGAQLALGNDLEQSLGRYARPTGAQATSASTPSPVASPERMMQLMTVMTEAAANDDEVAGRAAIGRFALEAGGVPEEQFVANFRYVQSDGWPTGYACTAVDAETGEFVVWDEASGVPLDRAVASSCAVPGVFAPVTIGGRRYVDGGMRSATNGDLAKGHDVVVLVSVMSPARMAGAAADPRAARFLARIESELDVLRDSGAEVHLLAPDDGAAAAIGLNVMDARQSPAAAAEGARQGEAAAEGLAALWG
jgi:NTE family protein